MKQTLLKNFFAGVVVIGVLFGSTAIAASLGTIDPGNTGHYKAAFLDSSVVSNTTINFGKFITQSQYNITVSDTELRGYAWGSSVGWIVMNCADTTSGCSSTNGNFKVANNAGLLSGYAWGENTGWINFGPFSSPGISTVKISNNGDVGGTLGSAGYAWSQNYGWIVFDCTNANTCVTTNWLIPSSGGGGGGGTSGGSGGGSTGTGDTGTGGGTVSPANPITPTDPIQPTTPTDSSGGDTTTQPSDGPTDAPTPITTEPDGSPAYSSDGSGLFSNGLLLPPTFVEAANNLLDNIGHVVTSVTSVIRTPAGNTITKAASAVGVAATVAAGIAMLALANPISLAEIFLLPFRLWSLLLVAFGFKKRNRPWGTVYDSVTKQPIDPAYVMLTDMQGNEVATSITDIDGRYGFSVAPGVYKIIANKTNFEFPSKKLAGAQGDELYANLYFGDTIVIKEEGEIIAKNIPMDQLNFDWNEFAKNEQKRLSYYHRSDVIIARISTIFFWLGFAVAAVALVASHSVYNGIVFVLYILMFLVRHYSPQFKAKGSISEALTDQPLPFAIVRALSAVTGQEVTHKVADRLGNYYGLVPNGTYNIVIDRKNADASYTKIPVTEAVTVKEGYLKESFKV